MDHTPNQTAKRAGHQPLLDRMSRDNGIDHLLTPPPAQTTGKIERFHSPRDTP